MINEQRTILMTRLASYEKGEGRKNVKIGNYFRSDYIAIQILKAVIWLLLLYLHCMSYMILKPLCRTCTR